MFSVSIPFTKTCIPNAINYVHWIHGHHVRTACEYRFAVVQVRVDYWANQRTAVIEEQVQGNIHCITVSKYVLYIHNYNHVMHVPRIF